MLKIPFQLLIVVLSLYALCNGNCISKKKLAERYINNDSTAIFSTHPSRPFKYGFAYSKEECEPFRAYLNNYKIKNGDVVADVGAASGWLEGVFSTMVDSVTFFVQDIDTNLLNDDQLNRVVRHFNSIRDKPQTNVFHLVMGTRKKSKLPNGIFDKIIINNTFHEFRNAGRMVEDLRTKVKPDGQVIVHDKMSNSYKKIRHEGCGIRADKADQVIYFFSGWGFYLTHMTAPKNSFDNYLTFELDAQKGEAYRYMRDNVEWYVQALDQMNVTKINTDSSATERIALSLKPHLKEMLEVYSSLESYLNALGYQLLKENKTKAAINVLRANAILFPESSNVYDSLGEAYLKDNDLTRALDNYTLSLKMNPGNKNAARKKKEIETRLLK